MYLYDIFLHLLRYTVYTYSGVACAVNFYSLYVYTGVTLTYQIVLILIVLTCRSSIVNNFCYKQRMAKIFILP